MIIMRNMHIREQRVCAKNIPYGKFKLLLTWQLIYTSDEQFRVDQRLGGCTTEHMNHYPGTFS